MTNRRFPVAGTELTISWEVVERAYIEYVAHVMYDPPLGRWRDIEEFEESGFTEAELDAWAPGWREQVR